MKIPQKSRLWQRMQDARVKGAAEVTVPLWEWFEFLWLLMLPKEGGDNE